MAVYHIVLFKFKSSVTPEQVKELHTAVDSMSGKIPGLIRVDFGAPLPMTAFRSKGYDCGLVAVLDKPETVKVYAEHDAHQEVHKMRVNLCEDTLAFDLEYEQ